MFGATLTGERTEPLDYCTCMNSFYGLMSVAYPLEIIFFLSSAKYCISVHLEVTDAYLANAFPQVWQKKIIKRMYSRETQL